MQIRAIEDGDIPAVLDLWARCGLLHPDNDPRADIARACTAADATLLVGFDGLRGWVYYLAVEPDLQRAGHGRAMLQAAEHWLRARKAPKLMLLVAEANAGVLGFYERLGFKRSPVVTLGKPL